MTNVIALHPVDQQQAAPELVGEGGYEGLTMYVFGLFEALEEPPVMRGFIVPTDVIPTMPEPPAAE